MTAAERTPWLPEEFEQRLRAREKYYHIHHPFHQLMNSGKLNRPEIQGWVANRFYYQISIPIKDAAIHQQRLNKWPEYYPWIESQGYAYFRKRLSEARRDVEYGLAITLEYFKTRDQQERALAILQFKLDVLWSMLDAMWMAYIEKRPPYYNVS